MNKTEMRVPAAQAPFFELPGRHGGLFVNLGWNFGERLPLDEAEVFGMMRRAPAGSVLLLRRLSSTERRRYDGFRRDVEVEAFAHLIHRDSLRWRQA